MPARSRYCDTCDFWHPAFEGASRGECRSRTPALIDRPPQDGRRAETLTMWPAVSASDWCGQWVAVPEGA